MRRHHGARLRSRALGRVGARRPSARDQRPLRSLPSAAGSGRSHGRLRAIRSPARSQHRLARRRQQRARLAHDRSRQDGHEPGGRVSARLRAVRSSASLCARARCSQRLQRRGDRVAGGRSPQCARGRHRYVDQHGSGEGDRGTPGRLCRLPGQQRADGARHPARLGILALFASQERRGHRRRVLRRAALARLRRGRGPQVDHHGRACQLHQRLRTQLDQDKARVLNLTLT